jgi:hypothetical protein
LRRDEREFLEPLPDEDGRVKPVRRTASDTCPFTNIIHICWPTRPVVWLNLSGGLPRDGRRNSGARIGEGELLFTHVKTDQDGASIRREHQSVVKHVRDCLMSLSQSARQFNDNLEREIATLLAARKKRLLANAGMVDAIGLPIKKRSGVPVAYAVPVTRRAPKIEHIRVQGSFKPEPTLAKADYEDILGIMKNMARVMELSPHAFVDMGEEALRSHFLVQLNGAYEGDAAGETFNFQGKTDILIRKDGKNGFIAECKFWKGEKAFGETLDQLLSYLSWRDTKTAVVLFNRNADFSAVLGKIAEMAPRHAHFKRDLGKSDESTFRYVFGQPNDTNREILLAVMAFDIPTPNTNAVEAGKK